MRARLTRLSHSFTLSLKHYGFSYLIALVASVLWIMVVDSQGSELVIIRELLVSCIVLFPLLLCGPLYQQISGNKSPTLVGIYTAIARGIGAIFFFYISYSHALLDYAPEHHSFSIVISCLSAWIAPLIVASVATRTHNLRTWGWRKDGIGHLLVSLMGAAILRGGIAACLGSVSYLFDVHIDYKRYLYVGIVSFCVVGVTIFLTRLGRSVGAINHSSLFRFFGLYIFFPLALIYALILLIYGIKILLSGVWPQGLVSYMVLGYVAWGLIAYFLTYHLREHSSIVGIHRAYFISILVFSLLLFGAIYLRISAYSLTEPRYFVAVLGLRIVIFATGSLLRPEKNLIIIVGSFVGLGLLSIYTPLINSSTLSQHYQLQRLESMLKNAGQRNGTSLVVVDKSLDEATEGELQQLNTIKNQVIYINRYYGSGSLEYLWSTTTGFAPQFTSSYPRELGGEFIKAMGRSGDIYQLDIREPELSVTDTLSFGIYSARDTSLSLSGYHTLIHLTNQPKSSSSLSGVTFSGANNEIIDIKLSGTTHHYHINLNDLGPDLYELSKTPQSLITKDPFIILVNNLSADKKDDKYSINYYDIILLLK